MTVAAAGAARPTAAAADLLGFVDGRFVAADDARRLPVIDPATELQVGTLLESDAAQVDAAVRAARTAFDSGVWSRQSTDRRQACMLRVRDLIMRNADALAASECTNTGIPLTQLRKLHIPGAAHAFQFYAELASQLKGELHQQRSGYQIQVSREPVGVAALISPWNGPVNMSSGKSANIILESADLERALDGALAAIFTTNGQQCLAGSRILVQRSIAPAFMRRFVERARAIRIGDPFDPLTELGPMAYRAHMEKVLAYAEVARGEGAVVLHGGARPARMSKGWYVEPTVVHAPSNSLRICQEEVFGPLATFIEFDTLDEAITITNASDFGLVAYLWTNDLSAVTRASREIRAGTIWVNTTLVGDPRAPFGGVKQSGSGREGGTGSIEFYTELKSVVIPNGPAPIIRLGLG